MNQQTIGILLMFVSTICYALLSPLMKKSSVGIPPFAIIAITMTILAMGAFVCSMIFEKNFQIRAISGNALALLGLVSMLNLIGFFLSVKAYVYLPISHQQSFALLSPVFASVAAYFILGEPLGWRLFAGAAIMSVGLLVVFSG
jgi:drug/metabolite transporter (DMT)-like permease